MAQFTFYCAEPDYPDVVQAILEQSAYGIIATWQPDDKVKVFHDYCKDLARSIKMNRRLYIVGSFSTEEIRLQKDADGYTVCMEQGGPLIALTLPGSKHLTNAQRLWAGDLWYRPWYDTTDRGTIMPSAELKIAFQDTKSRIRKLCRRIHLKKSLFVTDSVFKLIGSGEAEIQVNGQWLETSDLQNFVKRSTS